jgi:sulfur-oxidizing protein SoxY
MPTRREAFSAAFATAALFAAPRAGRAVEPEDPWPALAAQIFEGRPIGDGSAMLAIDAPYRAEDAAIVPLALRLLAPPPAGRIDRLTLTIDANPSPLAATLEFGPQSGIDRIATRVRVESYTNIHAVAETDAGALYAAARFIKASGGCSAPMSTVTADAIPLGTMRWRVFPPSAEDAASGLREAEIMVRHPNTSGMQMDQLTHLYVPAHFLKLLRVWQGEAPLLAVAGGISLAENPSFRFRFRPQGDAPIRAEAVDSKDATFRAEWPLGA